MRHLGCCGSYALEALLGPVALKMAEMAMLWPYPAWEDHCHSFSKPKGWGSMSIFRIVTFLATCFHDISADIPMKAGFVSHFGWPWLFFSGSAPSGWHPRHCEKAAPQAAQRATQPLRGPSGSWVPGSYTFPSQGGHGATTLSI